MKENINFKRFKKTVLSSLGALAFSIPLVSPGIALEKSQNVPLTLTAQEKIIATIIIAATKKY